MQTAIPLSKSGEQFVERVTELGMRVQLIAEPQPSDLFVVRPSMDVMRWDDIVRTLPAALEWWCNLSENKPEPDQLKWLTEKGWIAGGTASRGRIVVTSIDGAVEMICSSIDRPETYIAAEAHLAHRHFG